MVGTLEIQNFKSIKHLRLDCKRLNVFIGQPNTGKSNILESLGLLSSGFYCTRYPYQLNQFVRFNSPSNLFYDENIEDTLEVVFDSTSLKLAFKNRYFMSIIKDGDEEFVELIGDFDRLDFSQLATLEVLARFRFYKFNVHNLFKRRESDSLLPPSGENLLTLLQTKRELRALANQPFANYGLRLGLRPQEQKIEVIKEFEDIIVSYPYDLTSDTLQRLVFYMAAITTNKQSVLVFEEPESHAFPYYTKYLAEMIALDENENQYFISTHNPYFLLPILEKSSIDDIAIIITYYEDYQTKVKPMSNDDIQRMTEIDVFSNIESFLEP